MESTDKHAVYSLIQYVPDPFRQDALTVGIVFLHQASNFQEFRIATEAQLQMEILDRARATCGLRQLRVAQAWFETKPPRSAEELRAFAARLCNEIRMTKPCFSAQEMASAREFFDRLLSDLFPGNGTRLTVPSEIRAEHVGQLKALGYHVTAGFPYAYYKAGSRLQLHFHPSDGGWVCKPDDLLTAYGPFPSPGEALLSAMLAFEGQTSDKLKKTSALVEVYREQLADAQDSRRAVLEALHKTPDETEET